MRLLVTGGAGFIGSHFVRLILRERPDWEITNLDLLTYAGNPRNLVRGNPRHSFVQGDIGDGDLVQSLWPVDGVVNFAAESHVDRSILEPDRFLRTNALGTGTLLAVAKEACVERFLQVSTDEVYGSLGPEGSFSERTPLAPRSPYSASKAAADHLALSFYHTYGLPVLITRSSNNYGPGQYPEKLIPLLVTKALEGLPLPLYGDGLQVRDWLHVEDNCQGILAVLERGQPGQVYNLGGGEERTNLEVAEAILALAGGGEIRHVPDRPGHDQRYALDSSKAKDELGWKAAYSFAQGLAEVFAWCRDHREWWQG